MSLDERIYNCVGRDRHAVLVDGPLRLTAQEAREFAGLILEKVEAISGRKETPLYPERKALILVAKAAQKHIDNVELLEADCEAPLAEEGLGLKAALMRLPNGLLDSPTTPKAKP